jgi:hypothetical protein
MNKLFLAAGAFLSASAAFAGDAYIMKEPVMESSSSNDATGALVLLAIVGVIIATSTMAGRAKAEKDPYLMPTEEDDS